MANNEHTTCTIQRKQYIRVHHLNLNTGERKLVSEFWNTGDCNNPLFSKKERQTGICNSCRQGFEGEENLFANDDEKKRAMAS